MTKKITRSKPDTRCGTLLLTEVVLLILIVACVVAAFGSDALRSNDQRPTDNTASPKTLVATESVEHLERLARD
jgi:hypothetical protein